MTQKDFTAEARRIAALWVEECVRVYSLAPSQAQFDTLIPILAEALRSADAGATEPLRAVLAEHHAWQMDYAREYGYINSAIYIKTVNALSPADDLAKKPRFEQTYCSSCGKEFGPGDHGFSHCENHEGRSTLPPAPLTEKEESSDDAYDEMLADELAGRGPQEAGSSPRSEKEVMLEALRDVESKIVDFEAGRINWRPDDFLVRVRAAISLSAGQAAAGGHTPSTKAAPGFENSSLRSPTEGACEDAATPKGAEPGAAPFCDWKMIAVKAGQHGQKKFLEDGLAGIGTLSVDGMVEAGFIAAAKDVRAATFEQAIQELDHNGLHVSGRIIRSLKDKQP